jgi:hypothetical protein
MDRTRGHLLAAGLALAADRTRRARRHLLLMPDVENDPFLAPIRANLAAQEGEIEKAVRCLENSIGKLGTGEEATKSCLYRERGKLRLETGAFLEGLSDLAEAERLAGIAAEWETAAGAKLDQAYALFSTGDHKAALRALPPARALKGENRIRALSLRLLACSRRDEIPALQTGATRVPKTLAEARLAMARAWIAAERGDHELCRGIIESLRAAGWQNAVAEIGAGDMLLRAETALENGEIVETLRLIHVLWKKASPGLLRRALTTCYWLRMRAAAAMNTPAEALALGRKILHELESRRPALWAYSQLRGLSDISREFYKLMISLELRYGSTRRAFEALQQFSARGLLRRIAASKVRKIEKALADPDGHSHGRDHQGRWAARRLIRLPRGNIEEALSWRRIIEVLNRL